MPIERMDGDLRTRVLNDRGVVADVVPVTMRGDDELQRPVARCQLVGDPGERRDRGVDGDRLARARVREDMDVRPDGADDAAQAFHAASLAGSRWGRSGGRLRAEHLEYPPVDPARRRRTLL